MTCFAWLRCWFWLGGAVTTDISKVKGHADEGLVRDGRVRELDKIGNDMADQAADLGRRRVWAALESDRKSFSDACERWYPITGFSLLFPGLLFMKMVGVGWLLTLWFGLLWW